MVSWGNDILGALKGIIPNTKQSTGLGGDILSGLKDIGSWAERNIGQVHDVQNVSKYGLQTPIGTLGGSQPATTSLASPSAQQIVAGLNYQQTQRPDASTVQQLAQMIGQLSPTDAQKVMSSLSNTPLGQEVARVIQGQTVQQAMGPQGNPYGFDPLSMGQMFTNTIAPWLAQQEQQGMAETKNLGDQMQQALSGASPAIRQAFAVSIPAEEQAQQTMNEAINSAVATAPQWDQLIQGLTDARQAYLAAQQAAYYGLSSGSIPGGAPAAGQSALQGIMSSILAGNTAAPASLGLPVSSGTIP